MQAQAEETRARCRGWWRFRYSPAGPQWTRAVGFYWPHDDRPPTVADAVALLRFADLEWIGP